MNIYLVVAIGAAALAVAAGIWDGYRLRRNARYSPLVLAITAGGPVVSLVLFMLVGGLTLKLSVTLLLLAVGATTGLLVAGLTRISVVVPCEDGAADSAEPCAEPDRDQGNQPKKRRVPQVRLVGASWMPLPAALAVAALQVSAALESITWEVLALAALQAAVGFGVASAVVLVRRRSKFEQANGGPGGEAAEQPAGAAGGAATAQG